MRIAADSVTVAGLERLGTMGYVIEYSADDPEFIDIYKAKEEINEAVTSEAAG